MFQPLRRIAPIIRTSGVVCRTSHHSASSKSTHRQAHSKTPFGKFGIGEAVHLQVGDFAQTTKVFDAKAVEQFAKLTGDDNPVHLNENVARQTRFQRPVVHGMLVSSLIGTVFGSHIPGAIYVDQHLKFAKPTFVGDEVTATCTVTAIHKKFVSCDTTCTVDDEVVVKGVATVLIDHLHVDHKHAKH